MIQCGQRFAGALTFFPARLAQISRGKAASPDGYVTRKRRWTANVFLSKGTEVNHEFQNIQ
jgi:hypothetical protein